MYALMMRHETRTLTRAPAFAWVLLLLLVAMAFAAMAGRDTLVRQQAGAEAMATTAMAQRDKLHKELVGYERKLAREGGEKQIAAFSHSRGKIPAGTNAGTVGSTTAAPAILPATGLGAFATGQSDLQLAYLPVSSQSLTTITQGSELGNPVNLKRGGFDLAFVVVFLLPIFILAISYDMLSSEHERGTLAMVLSHPISLKRLMTSKVISRALIILGVVVLGGLAALMIAGSDLSASETWVRFTLWLAATLLYSLFWFALAVLVNAIGRNSATNGLVLAGIWLSLVAVVPTLVSVVATSVYPAPSRFDFITASREAQTKSEKNYMQALNQYYYDHVEYSPSGDTNEFLAVSMAKRAAVDKAMEPLFERFRAQRAQQDRIVSTFQFVSPAIMMQQALNAISGTDSMRYSHYIDQVVAFRTQWVDYFTKRFLKREVLSASDYAHFPKFAYREESLSSVAIRVAPALAGMLAFVVLIALGALQALRRYQVAAR